MIFLMLDTQNPQSQRQQFVNTPFRLELEISLPRIASESTSTAYYEAHPIHTRNRAARDEHMAHTWIYDKTLQRS